MASRFEQETTVTVGRDDGVAHIWSSNTVHLRRLRKDARVTEVYGDEEQGQFIVPVENYDVLRGLYTKRVMSAEQRAAAAERLRRG